MFLYTDMFLEPGVFRPVIRTVMVSRPETYVKQCQNLLKKMDYSKIKEKVLSADLGSAKMTDAKKAHIYAIVEENETGVVLRSDKGHTIPTTWAGLAALRCVATAEAAVKIVDTKGARESADVENFQTGINADKFQIDDTLTMTVVHKIKINDNVNNRPVYRNECYEGYGPFLDECSAINAAEATKKRDDQSNKDARNAAFQKATADLRKTALNKGTVDNETTWLQMPVFVVSN